MAKRRMIYLLVLALVAYVILLYDFEYLRLLAAMILVFPWISLFTLLPILGKIRLELGGEGDIVRGDGDASMTVSIHNQSRFPVMCVRVWAVLQEPDVSHSRSRMTLEFSLDGRQRQTKRVGLAAEHCGRASFYIRKIRVYDFLGLWSFPVKAGQRLQRMILPAAYPVDMAACLEAREQLRQCVPPAWNTVESMDEYDLRDYREGDRLHRVHWKLSARTQELQIRDYKARQQEEFLCLCMDRELLRDREQWDKYLDRAWAAMTGLLAVGDGYVEVLWQEANGPERCELTEEADALNCLYRLLGLEEAELSGEERTDGFPADAFWLKKELCLYVWGEEIENWSE